MTDSSIAAACAASLFVIALAIGLAGADKPPPVSFLLFVGVVGVLCAVAFARTKTHLAARSAGRPGIWLRIGLEGMTAGASVATVLALLGGGEPSLVVSFPSRLIGIGVAALVGTAFALMMWSLAAQLKMRFGKL